MGAFLIQFYVVGIVCGAFPILRGKFVAKFRYYNTAHRLRRLPRVLHHGMAAKLLSVGRELDRRRAVLVRAGIGTGGGQAVSLRCHYASRFNPLGGQETDARLQL